MKLPFTIYDWRFTICKKSGRAVSPLAADGAHGVTRPTALNHKSSITNHQSRRAFTLVEIAISLAIIGVALLGIIGVLPLGLHTQRDNRESTIINQDATVFIEAIRNGLISPYGADLTNYVYAITNFQTPYNPNAGATIPIGYNNTYLTNNARIIGLLSMPEFVDNFGNPITNVFSGGYSNHVIAYVHSISGPAVEKPPQDNDILRSDSFSYRIFCVNAPVAFDNYNQNSSYANNLQSNLHELRLTFEWPQQPNGKLGLGRQTYRTLVAGQMILTSDDGVTNYFYQPQSFTSAP